MSMLAHIMFFEGTEQPKPVVSKFAPRSHDYADVMTEAANQIDKQAERIKQQSAALLSIREEIGIGHF